MSTCAFHFSFAVSPEFLIESTAEYMWITFDTHIFDELIPLHLFSRGARLTPRQLGSIKRVSHCIPSKFSGVDLPMQLLLFMMGDRYKKFLQIKQFCYQKNSCDFNA